MKYLIHSISRQRILLRFCWVHSQGKVCRNTFFSLATPICLSACSLVTNKPRTAKHIFVEFYVSELCWDLLISCNICYNLTKITGSLQQDLLKFLRASQGQLWIIIRWVSVSSLTLVSTEIKWHLKNNFTKFGGLYFKLNLWADGSIRKRGRWVDGFRRLQTVYFNAFW